MTYASTRKADQAGRLTNPKESEISEIEVNRKKAFRFDVTGEYKGQKYTYLITIIEGETEIAHLNAWTNARNFEQQRGTLEALAMRVTGL